MSGTGTPLRQMSIVECFRCAKPKSFKMEKPFNVSSVCIVIDSDSDNESPPPLRSEDAPSPAKRSRIMAGVNDPKTPASKPSLLNNNRSPVTPHISNVEEANIPNGLPLNRPTDTTILYQYAKSEMDCWDESTVPFLSSGGLWSNDQVTVQEKLCINFDDSAMDSFPSQENNIDQPQPVTLDVNTPRKKPTLKNIRSTTLTLGKTPIANSTPRDAETTKETPLAEDGLKKKKRKKNVNKNIDKVDLNQEVTVPPVPLKENCVMSQISNQKEVGTPVQNPTTSSSPAAPNNSSSVEREKIKSQDTTSFQNAKSNPPTSTPRNVIKLHENTILKRSTIKKKSDTIDKVISSSVDNQQPCCSKSSLDEDSTRDQQNMSSVERDTSTNKASISPNKEDCITPQKQKMGPKTPVKSSNPKKLSSPAEGSPTKNRAIKALKSKEGKQLQVKQMDELVKLFETVTNNRHLRALLDNNEKSVLKKFLDMEENKKYVVMKLFVWQKRWYNIFNFCTKAQLAVTDDKDIRDIFEYLKEEQFVDTEYKTLASLPELLNTLDLPKVKEVMVDLRMKPKTSKAANVETLLVAASKQVTLCTRTFEDIIRDVVEKKFGHAFKIKDDVYTALLHVYQLATFTNPEFYAMDQYFRYIIHLNVVFPEFPIEEYTVFYSRDKFIKYGEAMKMRAELEERLTGANKFIGIYNIGEEAYTKLCNLEVDTDDHQQAPHLKRFTARYVYCKILSICCENIFSKQNGRPSEVKKWLEYLIKEFPSSRRLGKWYFKLISLHMRHLDVINYKTAAKLLIDILDTKGFMLGEIAKHDLATLGNKLKSSKKHKLDQLYHDRLVEVLPRSIDSQSFPATQTDYQCIRSENSGLKRMYFKKGNDGMTVSNVEKVALDHYAEHGYPEGEHCEGSLARALLMLFFWDIIYNPTTTIPATFISKLQSAPLDMFTPFFYNNRKELIDKRLKEIGSEWSEDMLINFAANSWQNHSHENTTFGMIMNTIKDDVTVEVLITVIGRKVLMKIFERLIKNIKEFSSGMPDLLVWNVDEKKCKFVEVKGEGDRLSTGQTLWLKYLQDSGASIEVCWVHSTGSKRKKIKNGLTKSVEQQQHLSENDEENEMIKNGLTKSVEQQQHLSENDEENEA